MTSENFVHLEIMDVTLMQEFMQNHIIGSSLFSSVIEVTVYK